MPRLTASGDNWKWLNIRKKLESLDHDPVAELVKMAKRRNNSPALKAAINKELVSYAYPKPAQSMRVSTDVSNMALAVIPMADLIAMQATDGNTGEKIIDAEMGKPGELPENAQIEPIDGKTEAHSSTVSDDNPEKDA